MQVLFRAYEEVRHIEYTFSHDSHNLSNEEKEQLPEQRKSLRFVMTHTEKDEWYATYLLLQQSVIRHAKHATWGDRN